MPILSDADLARIWPDSPHIQPASINLHIGAELKVWPRWILRDPRVDQSAQWKPLPTASILDPEGEPVDEPCWILRPHCRYLAATRERIRIPDDCAGQIAGRSSWGRDGLNVLHGPAGFIDAGFVGVVVLELSVVGSELVLWPGASVAQLIVHRLETPCARPYGHVERASKYQQQGSVTPSKTHLEVAGHA